MIIKLLEKQCLNDSEIVKNGYYYLIEILLPDNRIIPVIASDIVDFFDEVFLSGLRFIHIYWGMRPA